MMFHSAFFSSRDTADDFELANARQEQQNDLVIFSLTLFLFILCRSMSHDSVTRHSPPDFGDDDEENKDDQQMFVSATLAPTDDVPLDEEEEEDNPFGAPASFQKKTPVATANELAQNDLASTVAYESHPTVPIKQELPSLVSEKSNSPTEMSIERSTIPLDSPSSTSTRSLTNETTTTATKSVPKRSTEHNIEITVSDPTKVGEVCRYCD